MPPADVAEIYADLAFGPVPQDRPYALINMVATIDGKILSGNRDESVVDLGSKNDHELMRRIEAAVDGVLVGAGTLRATSPLWNPQSRVRVAVSSSAKLDYTAAFFKGESYVACAERAPGRPPTPVGRLAAGADRLDVAELVRKLRVELSVERLLILGGSETNAEFLSAGLVDELFLTIAPKVKLGRDVPTYAGGEPLDRERLLSFELLETHAVHDEVFLRYRRKESS